METFYYLLNFLNFITTFLFILYLFDIIDLKGSVPVQEFIKYIIVNFMGLSYCMLLIIELNTSISLSHSYITATLWIVNCIYHNSVYFFNSDQ